METLKGSVSKIRSFGTNNPKLLAGLAVSSLIGSYITLSLIPSKLFYSGIDACPSETRCNAQSTSLPSNVTKETVSWQCDGTTIRGYLFQPSSSKNNQNYPCIIMAHGFGHTIAMGLIKYAHSYCANGYVVLLFDYRSFGISDGSPRHVVSPSKHIEDWISAIRFIKNNHAQLIDSKRIGLWGSSFSGGHVLAVSSKVKGIKAIISNAPFIGFTVPHVKAESDMNKVLTLLYGCIVSKIRSYIPFCSELYCRVMRSEADDGEKIAFLDLDKMNESESQCKWVNDEFVADEMKNWRNGLSVGNVFEILKYKPYTYIDLLNVNGTAVLYVYCESDRICPSSHVKYAMEKTEKGSIHQIDDAVHFDIYQGEVREAMIKKHIAFYAEHL